MPLKLGMSVKLSVNSSALASCAFMISVSCYNVSAATWPRRFVRFTFAGFLFVVP